MFSYLIIISYNLYIIIYTYIPYEWFSSDRVNPNFY